LTDRLRVLMPSIYFPPRVGGIESHVYYLARELVRRGHSVHVVTTHTEPESPWTETMDGVEVTRMASFGKHFLGWSLASASSTPETIRLARNCDIIHSHTFASALGGGAAAAFFGRPHVVTVHSSHFLRLARNPIMRNVMRLLLMKAGALLSTSREIDGVVRSMLPGSFTMPIVNGIDTETFRPSEPCLNRRADEFVIVCPRRLVRKNGVEYLVRALPLIGRELPVRAYLAGDGPLRQYLEGLAVSLGVRDNIEFMGSVENNRMPNVYSSADLIVIPSLVEATSIAALEAMSCERVVAASRVGGLPEIIDDRVGILFESGSPEAAARAVVKAAREVDRGALGRAARERVIANWSIQSMVDVHMGIYMKLIGERHRD
jgi:glycosyltransferase involved in cell wall biosynthesis